MVSERGWIYRDESGKEKAKVYRASYFGVLDREYDRRIEAEKQTYKDAGTFVFDFTLGLTDPKNARVEVEVVPIPDQFMRPYEDADTEGEPEHWDKRTWAEKEADYFSQEARRQEIHR